MIVNDLAAGVQNCGPAVPGGKQKMRQRKGFSYCWPEKYEDWANGFLAGNGELGIIVLGNPLDETVIFNHRRFNIAATHPRSFATVDKRDLEEIRKACAGGDFKRANDLADQTHGWQDGGEGNRHPGFRMKIQTESSGEVAGYFRECDYRIGVIRVSWCDKKGKWNRSAFVSRKDNVVVQRIIMEEGSLINCSLQVGIESRMHLPEGMEFFWENTVEDSKTDVSGSMVFRAIYPKPDKTGYAGYEGVTRVIVRGEAAECAVQAGTAADWNGGQERIAKEGCLRISGAEEILLLTGIERYDHNCREEWGKKQLQKKLTEMPDTYEVLLQRHVELHQPIYDRVMLNLDAPEEERIKSNEELLKEQKRDDKPNPALFERLFDAGRYHYLCTAGETGVPDLLGIWTGDCNVGWNGYYHLDANLNFQISGAIIGNMPEMMEGYFRLNEAWKEDFRTNAGKLLGCRGLLACGNSPGPSSGLISALNYAYPYHYVTGEEAWLLYPFWEYYLATGDVDFLKNRLYPLLYELGLFYEDFLVEKDAEGKFIFAGSISPENQPKGLGLSLVNNSAFDIAGARFGLSTLLKVCGLLDVEQGPGEGAARWKKILEYLPDYRINEDGALAEWAWEGLEDNYDHRHSSGLIGAFPYHEITPEADGKIFQAARVALQKRDEYTYEDAGHGLLHGALIAAVVKNPSSVSEKLLRLAKEDFYYTGLATAHYPEGRVFCTDVAHTLPAILMEMLIYSDEGVLELLPALPDGFPKGEIRGMLGRNRITIDRLTWDMEQGKVYCQMTSAVDQEIKLIWRRENWKTFIRSSGSKSSVEPTKVWENAVKVYLEKNKIMQIELLKVHKKDN